jgi:hypothetical protein
MSPRRYLFEFLLSLAVFVVLFGAFNSLINPYLIYPFPRIAGLSSLKVASGTREPFMKAYDAPRHAASTLILGSSRSDIGLNPQAAQWLTDQRPVYNMSLAGSNLAQSVAYLEHYLRERGGAEGLKRLYVGLDFESYLHPTVGTSKRAVAASLAPDDIRIGVAPSTQSEVRLQRLKDTIWSTLSLDATGDSVSTMLASMRGQGGDMRDDGQFADFIMSQGVVSNGYRGLFEAAHLHYLKFYGNGQRQLERSGAAIDMNWKAFETLIELCVEHHLELIIYLQPAHAERWDLLQRLGHGQDLEVWKADVFAGVQAGRRQGVRVLLFDLAGYDKAHIQEVPLDRLGSGSSSFNYFDSVHYRGELAQLLLNALVSARVDPLIGVAIDDEKTLTERQHQVRQQRKVWRTENFERSAQIGELICYKRHC